MGLLFPLVSVTELPLLIRSASVDVLSCGSHDLASIRQHVRRLSPAEGVVDDAFTFGADLGRIGESHGGVTDLSNVYHGNILLGWMVWYLGREKDIIYWARADSPCPWQLGSMSSVAWSRPWSLCVYRVDRS